MTALGVRYLRGVAVANDVARQRPEWPPHPGRVFMALAAAYFETGKDAEEKRALEWLERQHAPGISASGAYERSFVETYVPVNDKLDKKQPGSIGRGRQPRVFQTARPERDSVFLVWRSEAPEDVRGALAKLCEKVTRLGHSSSLVQMWVASAEEAQPPSWLPSEEDIEARMRVTSEGTLNGLELAFGESRPALSNWQGYAKAEESGEESDEISRGPFDARPIVFSKFEGSVIGLETTLQLTGALRNAAMAAVKNDVPEWLSAHQADGAPSTKPHASFFPLPFVEAPYADGHIMGVAMAIPRGVSEQEQRQVIRALLFDDKGEERKLDLWAKDHDDKHCRPYVWKWTAEREKRAKAPETLEVQTWTRASRRWASVTPVVLHHYPKKNRDADVERIVREAFESALLPEPLAIEVRPVSWFGGVGHARSMPEYAEGGTGMCRYQVHAVVQFAQKVEGPVLVGRGRFRGYGLFRPVKEARHGQS